jgi:hypothetical protein
MHLYVIARGNVDFLNRWKNNLLAQFLPWEPPPDHALHGKRAVIQLGVRPVEMIEITFPRNCLKAVLGMVQPYDGMEYYGGYLKMLRKILKLKSLPRVRENVVGFVRTPHVGVTGVGLRDDHMKDGFERL